MNTQRQEEGATGVETERGGGRSLPTRLFGTEIVVLYLSQFAVLATNANAMSKLEGVIALIAVDWLCDRWRGVRLVSNRCLP